MRILETPIDKSELLESEFVHSGPMVKGVVDIGQNLLAIDAQMHADLEALLLENGSKQENLWGINLYPEGKNFIIFESFINIRPKQNNFGTHIDDPKLQKNIEKVVKKWIK